jgi:hypothetical protein
LGNLGLIADPKDIKHDVSILDQAKFAEAKSERLNKRLVVHVGGGTNREETYPNWIFRLLPARRERPCDRRAAEKRDEIASLHSITSSASASTLSDTLRPSAFAVLRLIANSNLVGCITGKSAGFSPLRIRPT